MSFYTILYTRFALDLAACFVLVFLLYYLRYRDKETTIAMALFNIFAFAVLSILSTVEFGIAAGFGLFAVLALFNLRSEQINKTDIAYFFGSISLAVITSIPDTHQGYQFAILIIVLLAVYIVDHPRILRTVSQVKLTLDTIPTHILSDPQALNQELSQTLGVTVLSSRVTKVDFVTEIANVEVHFRSQK